MTTELDMTTAVELMGPFARQIVRAGNNFLLAGRSDSTVTFLEAKAHWERIVSSLPDCWKGEA